MVRQNEFTSRVDPTCRHLGRSTCIYGGRKITAEHIRSKQHRRLADIVLHTHIYPCLSRDWKAESRKITGKSPMKHQPGRIDYALSLHFNSSFRARKEMQPIHASALIKRAAAIRQLVNVWFCRQAKNAFCKLVERCRLFHLLRLVARGEKTRLNVMANESVPS